MDILFLGSTCGRGSFASQISPDAVSSSRRQGHCCAHLAQEGTHTYLPGICMFIYMILNNLLL